MTTGRGVAVMPGRSMASGRRQLWRVSRGWVVTIAWVVNIVSARHWGGVSRHRRWLGIHVGDMGHRPRGRHTVGHQLRSRVAAGRRRHRRGVARGWVAGHWHWRPGLGGSGCIVVGTCVDGDGRPVYGDRGHAGSQGHAGEGGQGPYRGRGVGPGRCGGWSAVHFTESTSSYLQRTHSRTGLIVLTL